MAFPIKSILSSLAVVADFAVMAAPAHATQPLYGGGSMLASEVYRQIFNCYGTPLFGSTQSNPIEGAPTPFPTSLPRAQCNSIPGNPPPPDRAEGRPLVC